MFDKSKSVFGILARDMAMKSLDRQLNLMALMMVHVEIWVKGNVAIYSTKSTSINMENLAVVGVLMVHTVIVI